MSGAGVPPSGPEARQRWVLGILGLPILGLLAIEFLLGMALNLYVSLPSGSALSMLETSPVLIVHILVGVMLAGITARVLILGIRLRDRSGVVAGALGLLSTLVAFLAGMAFTFGGQELAASYVMSVGFTGILLSAALLLLPRRPAGAMLRLPGVAEPGEAPAPRGGT
jgi:hypothetical protein